MLLCASASGEKLKLLVIGKSKNPRSFNGYHHTSLRVTYEANKKAWMTGQIFESWLKKVNQQMRVQNRKILLFMDNCGAHPHLTLSNVKLVFFPPNTTSRLQPMDAGVIQALKVHYRKKLLRHVLMLMDDVDKASDISRQITVLDAILWLISSWDAVKPETIQKCFGKCGFGQVSQVIPDSEEQWDEEDLAPLLPAGQSIVDYANMDEDLCTENNNDSDDWEEELIKCASVFTAQDGVGSDE